MKREDLEALGKKRLMAIGAEGGLDLHQGMETDAMIDEILSVVGAVDNPEKGQAPSKQAKDAVSNIKDAVKSAPVFMTPGDLPRDISDRVAITLQKPADLKMDTYLASVNGYDVRMPFDVPVMVPRVILDGPLKDARETHYEMRGAVGAGESLSLGADSVMQARPPRTRFVYQIWPEGSTEYDEAMANYRQGKAKAA